MYKDELFFNMGEDIYDDWESMLDSEEISAEEEGFMKGWADAYKT